MNSFLGNLLIFSGALFLVIRSAEVATKYAAQLAESYRLSKYTVGFIIVAVISILPETLISLVSAFEGSPSFGLGVLFGSNIADLTLIFALIVFLAGRGLKVESKVLKNSALFPVMLLLPLIFGFDGHFSRSEGVVLMVSGALFYYRALKGGVDSSIPIDPSIKRSRHICILLGSMALLLLGAHFTVTSATWLAIYFSVSPILVGMSFVAVGTTMPEFLFALKSVKHNNDSLAIGDIFGTVLADATIVVGLLALVSPFSFPLRIMYISGLFMVAASYVLLHFMYSGHTLTRREASLLFGFWVLFILVEFIANTWV